MSNEEVKRLLQGCKERIRLVEVSTSVAELTLEHMYVLRDRLAIAERTVIELRDQIRPGKP